MHEALWKYVHAVPSGLRQFVAFLSRDWSTCAGLANATTLTKSYTDTLQCTTHVNIVS